MVLEEGWLRRSLATLTVSSLILATSVIGGSHTVICAKALPPAPTYPMMVKLVERLHVKLVYKVSSCVIPSFSGVWDGAIMIS